MLFFGHGHKKSVSMHANLPVYKPCIHYMGASVRVHMITKDFNLISNQGDFTTSDLYGN